MEYSLETFCNTLKDYFLNNPNMPLSSLYYMDRHGNLQLNSEKHPNRNPLHLKDAIKNSFEMTTTKQENFISFDLGNEQMEITHPYYHILQNTLYIRKRNQGSEKTKGSQAYIERAKRDYEEVSWNGKTFVKEYSRNVRGSRKRDDMVTMRYGNVLVHREGNSYKNEHYRYIDRILDSVTNILAAMFGAKLTKTSTGLADEYFSQFSQEELNMFDSDIVNTFFSFDDGGEEE